MFNDIGMLEILAMAVLGMLIFGPDKLPKVIQDVSRTIRKIRDFSDSAKRDIRDELGPEFKDFEFEDLNPKTFMRKQLGNDELGLQEIRNSFDLRKEMSDLSDAVNDRGDSSDDFLDGPSGGRSGSSSGAATDGGRIDMLKKPGRDADERPPFDSDAT
ncbi:Sec-independent protein translocase TatB [Streptomyces sp. SID4919]|uniref:Sec-independent protein translocase protein TatB n=1 Tax=Streptomyces uncialis TaxID=1048205 RepID=A0A1Q4VEV3_9ACTN|nr:MULTISPECIES: sec-independent translocase [Streptomyces]MYY11270.1 Sec-independent protein translocase TatB [Streptomyces sp. SID4919]MCX4660281.1 sec-independent translocase [Streptomyces uncialis]OKH96354.1 preprotein translocase [Streptomyces uncialis]WST68313.1 sec-independent translocase [Streptomyces uncialis]WTE13055.1 sec-independent translocase [Streptomyces uncialis]